MYLYLYLLQLTVCTYQILLTTGKHCCTKADTHTHTHTHTLIHTHTHTHTHTHREWLRLNGCNCNEFRIPSPASAYLYTLSSNVAACLANVWEQSGPCLAGSVNELFVGRCYARHACTMPRQHKHTFNHTYINNMIFLLSQQQKQQQQQQQQQQEPQSKAFD